MAPQKGSKRKAVLKYGTNKVPRSSQKYAKELYSRLKKQAPEFLRARNAKYQKKFRDKLKADLLAAYGGKCACCGESNPGFLTIDHINRDGRDHRARVGGSAQAMYCDIRRRNYPADYRLLCFNCNMGRESTPDHRCPHEHARALREAS